MASIKDTAVNDNGFVKFPEGTDLQRPNSPAQGMMRFNSNTGKLEGYDGSKWQNIALGAAAGGAGDPSDLSTIQNAASMRDIAYATIPGGPRTALNYVTSFGQNENSNNTGNEPWDSGFDQVSFDFIDTGGYFLSGLYRLFSGDGSADGGDWVLWNFGPAGGGDFNPDVTASGSAFFGGEFINQSGATNAGFASEGYIWGFETGADWVLLWREPLGDGPGNWGKNNPGWYQSGTTTQSGFGKRPQYDSLSISHIGFSVS